LVIDELTQTKEPIPLSVEHEDFQLVGFESINNHLTLGNIKTTNVLVHHYCNMHVQDNNVVVNNDPNNVFGKAIIDFYLLGVSSKVNTCIESFLHEVV
jgi:hypothetical protein